MILAAVLAGVPAEAPAAVPALAVVLAVVLAGVLADARSKSTSGAQPAGPGICLACSDGYPNGAETYLRRVAGMRQLFVGEREW